MKTGSTFLLLLLLSSMLGKAVAQNGKIAEIQFNGLKNISREAVIATIKTRPGQLFSDAQLKQDQDAIRAMGVFSYVSSPHVEVSDAGAKITFDLIENPLIQDVRFKGNTVISAEQLKEVLQNKPGRVLNSNFVRGDANAIEERYRKDGYVALVEDYVPSQADPSILEITVQESRIGKITVSGNRKTRDRVIIRELQTKPGDLFNTNRWARDLARLYNMDYFESIEPEEDISPEPGVRDIILRVKEKPTGRINFGFAIDSRQRLIGLLELFDTNFRGLGQTVGVNFQSTGGSNGSSIELLFTEPWLDRRHTSLSVSLYNKLVFRFTSNFFGGGGVDPGLEQRYDERRRGALVNLGRPLSDTLSVGIGVRVEEVTTNDIATTGQTGFIRQNGSIYSLPLRGVRNTRDFDLDPASGSYMVLNIEPGIANIKGVDPAFQSIVRTGRSDFLKASLDLRSYLSPQGSRTKPDDPRHVFAFRAFYGTIGGTVPFFEQFFTGGAENLRGYPEDRFWGKNSFLLSAEYRIPLQKAFTGVLFVDYGDAWGGYPTVNRFTQHRRFDPALGVGLGVRVRTPLGPIRIDYGVGREGGRTHISIGQVF